MRTLKRVNEAVRYGERPFYHFCEWLSKELEESDLKVDISVDDYGRASLSCNDLNFELRFLASFEQGDDSLVVTYDENSEQFSFDLYSSNSWRSVANYIKSCIDDNN